MTRLILTSLLAVPAWAQCVMCREAAASQKSAAIAAFNTGIVVLAVPLACALIGIGRLVRRYGGPPTDR